MVSAAQEQVKHNLSEIWLRLHSYNYDEEDMNVCDTEETLECGSVCSDWTVHAAPAFNGTASYENNKAVYNLYPQGRSKAPVAKKFNKSSASAAYQRDVEQMQKLQRLISELDWEANRYFCAHTADDSFTTTQRTHCSSHYVMASL